MRRASSWQLIASVLVWGTGLGVCGAQTTSRVSVDATGTQVMGANRQPSAGANGRFVAFASTATTLVAGDGNGTADVFVKDRQTGAVTRVSLRTGGLEAVGDSVAPDISADGRYVTFVSAASLTADDTNLNSCPGANLAGPTCPDVFRHDRTTGETIRVSVASGGAQVNAASGAPRISGDGRYVVFESLATTLVAGDTNGLRDIFLRDVQGSTTTRVSVSTGGVQADREASFPAISDDGARISFLSNATTLDATADPLPCDPAVFACTRVFVRAVAATTTTRLAFTIEHTSNVPIVAESYRLTEAAISADGTSVTGLVYGVVDNGSGPRSVDATTTALLAAPPAVVIVSNSASNVQPPRLTSIASDASGRSIAYCSSGGGSFGVRVFDQQTWVAEVGSSHPDCESVSMTPDGLTVFFATSGGSIVAGDTNAAFDVFALDLDEDDDGMATRWEAHFGLNALVGSDGALDADGDGATNAQEYRAGTHPRGLFKYYLAEGAQNDFFTTEITIFKPIATSPDVTSIVGQFLGQNGRRTVTPILNIYNRTTGGALLRVAKNLGLQMFPMPDQVFSTLIESSQPMAVERSLTWGGGMGAGYGSHAERAVSGPASTWHFAEGATHGAYDLFYLLQNPGATTATATITYLLPAPQAPIVRTYTLLPNSRRTIYVDQEPGLDATDVSARIDADRAIFAERAMYMSIPGQAFAGGTASAGITAPATQWFIAEGATGSFFDLYILIGNPSAGAAAVTVTYLLPDGSTVETLHEVAGQSRRTIVVKAEDARLAATAMSATITSTNGTPIVVERAMWWPTPAYYEGTVTAATTAAAVRWALAGGYIDRRPETETYLLLANPGTTAANVTIDVGANGAQVPAQFACRVTVAVPGRGRYTAGIKSLCPALSSDTIPGGLRVAGTIESDGPPIVVERSTYWSAGGQFWAAGASTLLTPLP